MIVGFSARNSSRAVGAKTSRPNLRVLIILLACICCSITTNFSGADETGESSRIPYRRIFVPSEQPEVWPLDGNKFLPIDAGEFEELIQKADDASQPAAGPRITHASYSARLDGTTLIGRGLWRIELPGKQPALLDIGSTSLRLLDPNWAGNADDPVRWGVWSRHDASERLQGLEVPGTGTLEFACEISGRQSHHGIEIPLHLPDATITGIVLDLPETMRPVLEGSVVTQSRESADEVAAHYAADELNESTRRWTVSIGPSSDDLLRIVDSRPDPAGQSPTWTLRDTVRYQLHQRGLDMVATLNLNDPARESRSLVISVPPGVRIMDAQVNGTSLSWQITPGQRGATSRAIIELPPRTDNEPRRVEVRAWQALHLDRSWTLPRLRVEDVFWTSGRMELWIAPTLELRALVPTDCRRTVNSATTLPAEGETWSFEAFSPTPSLEVVVGTEQPRVEVQQVTELDISDPEITGRMVSSFRVPRGSVHRITADIASSWVVEAIESVPAGALDAWRVDGGKLELQLAQAARDDQPLRIVVSGRLHRSGFLAPLSRDSLQLLQWSDVKVSDNFVAINTLEPYIVELAEGLPVVAWDDLTADSRDLFSRSTHQYVYDLQDAPANAAVRLGFQRGNYAVDIQIDATYAGDRIHHAYQIVCRPQGNPIEQLLVHVSDPLKEELEWNLASTGSHVAKERLAPSDPRAAGLQSSGQLWLLRLRQPTLDAVELTAETTQPADGRTFVPLLSLPESSTQRVRVYVHSQPGLIPVVRPQGISPAPLPTQLESSPNRSDSTRICAAYRYEPAQWLSTGRRARLSLAPPDRTDRRQPPRVVAPWLSVESFYSLAGIGAHRAVYTLENEGASRIMLQMGRGARLISASADGQPLPVKKTGGAQISVELPTGQRQTVLSLLLETSQPRLRPGSEIRPPIIASSFTHLAGQWLIQLPEEFTIDGVGELRELAPLNWRARLFGPLGRGGGQHPFVPTHVLHAGWSVARSDEQQMPTVLRSTMEPSDDLLAAVGSQSSRVAPPEPRITNRNASKDAETSPIRSALLPAMGESSTAPGWRLVHVTFLDGRTSPLTLMHRPVATAWSLATFLAALAGGRLLWWFNRVALIALTATAACLALLLPAIYAPLATGAALGFMLSPLTTRRRDSLAHDVTVPGGRITTVTAALFISIAALAVTAAVDAAPSEARLEDDPPAAAAPLLDDVEIDPAEIERVLIPVDKDRKPVGGKYFVSESFLRKLFARSKTQEGHPGDWLIRRAEIHGTIDGSPTDDRVPGRTWTLTLDMEIFVRDTTVKLPLRRQEAEWATTVSLDGIPAPLAWNADQNNCQFTVPEPGRYVVTLSFAPHFQVTEKHRRVDLTVLPLVDTAFTLNHSANIAALSVDGESQPHREEVGTVSGFLDGSGRLAVRWLQEQVQSARARRAAVSELRWLQIGPDGIMLWWKLIAEESPVRPDPVAISVDRRWKPENVQHSTETLDDTSGSGRRLIELPFAERQMRDGRSRWEAELQLRLLDSQALGHYRLPPLEMTSLQRTAYRLALTVHPSLQCEPLEGNQWSTAEGDEFIAAWGEQAPADSAQIVIADAPAGQFINLAVRPSPTESQIDEVLHIAAERNGLRIQYQADVAPSEPHRYQFSIEIPPALEVDDVLVSQSGRPVALRWARLPDDRVNVFFAESLNQPYRLVLVGRTATQGASYALPHVSAIANDSPTQHVQLYRDEAVLLNVDGPAKQLPAGDEPVNRPPLAWTAQLTETYRLDETSAESVRLSVHPNVVQCAGETLTSLHRQESGWSVTFRCDLTIEDGQLNSLRFRAPNGWSGPLETSGGPADYSVEPLGHGQSLIKMRLLQPVSSGETLSVELSGPFVTPSSEPIAVPRIVPEIQGRLTNYISVPASVDGQQAIWSRVGVEPAELPNELRPMTPTAATEPFRVVRQPFRVALEAQPAEARTAAVRLADTVAVYDVDGAGFARTQFVVVPQGLIFAGIDLPAGEELVSVKLAGRPALVQSINQSSWQVQLGPPRLPQILEVVTRNPHGRSENSRKFELKRPVLTFQGRALPVELSLWSVRRPPTQARAFASQASAETMAEQWAVRLERLVSIAESALPAAVENGTPDGRDWFRPWAEQLSQVSSAARRLLNAPQHEDDDSTLSSSEAERLRQARGRVDAWLTDGEELWPHDDADIINTLPTVHEGVRSSFEIGRLPGDWFHYVADGGADTLAIELVPTSLTPTQVRTLGVLAIVATAAAAVWWTRCRSACDVFWRYPHLIGVLGGLAYWAWLWPSWVGILIAAASTALVFLPAWRTSRT